MSWLICFQTRQRKFGADDKNQLDLPVSNKCKVFISGLGLGARIMLEIIDETTVLFIDDLRE